MPIYKSRKATINGRKVIIEFGTESEGMICKVWTLMNNGQKDEKVGECYSSILQDATIRKHAINRAKANL